jgi:hypothetical protein
MKHLSSFDGFLNEESLNEATHGKCMSEATHKKLNEMYESMCNEMEKVHNDESKMTAENYSKECSEKLTEMMKKMESACEACMGK